MRIAILASNMIRIHRMARKGSEIFVYIYLKELEKVIKKLNNFKITLFASGNSKVIKKIENINNLSSDEDKAIGIKNHKIFELALLSKAFSMQKQFDLYHVHMGIGETVLPFARFIKKPILITLHGTLDLAFSKKFFSIFQDLRNVHFISISNSQRKIAPYLNYIKTIHHGIETRNNFKFNAIGGKTILWAGRGTPEKGLDIVLNVVKKMNKRTKIFPILKEESSEWLEREVLSKIEQENQETKITMDFNVHRVELIPHYQSSKLFLFPIRWEEPFGLVMIESMACGTPVIAYAKGSVPEIIKDGETGFIVNSSPTDIRGDWIIKKTGVEGLCEAVERIYSMSQDKYMKIRQACRAHVEKHFTVERMVQDYIEVYKQLARKT